MCIEQIRTALKICLFKLISSDTGARVTSIEVVTQSQFALLEAAVKELEAKGGPPPPPKMPDNKKLKEDIVKGSASLTDTMHAMNVSDVTVLLHFILLDVYYILCCFKRKRQCSLATFLSSSIQ